MGILQASPVGACRRPSHGQTVVAMAGFGRKTTELKWPCLTPRLLVAPVTLAVDVARLGAQLCASASPSIQRLWGTRRPRASGVVLRHPASEGGFRVASCIALSPTAAGDKVACTEGSPLRARRGSRRSPCPTNTMTAPWTLCGRALPTACHVGPGEAETPA